jgi:hypothetical protein
MKQPEKLFPLLVFQFAAGPKKFLYIYMREENTPSFSPIHCSVHNASAFRERLEQIDNKGSNSKLAISIRALIQGILLCFDQQMGSANGYTSIQNSNLFQSYMPYNSRTPCAE